MYGPSVGDSFSPKQPKNRKVQRIIINEQNKETKKEDEEEESQKVSLTLTQLRANLEQTFKKREVKNDDHTNNNNTAEEQQEINQNIEFSTLKEGDNKQIIEKATEIFGERIRWNYFYCIRNKRTW